jgi:hypothetical protein
MAIDESISCARVDHFMGKLNPPGGNLAAIPCFEHAGFRTDNYIHI